MVTWLTAEECRAEPYWPECDLDPGDSETALTTLLTSARTQCEAFAPALADDADVPETYRLAQAMQARALWRSGAAGASDHLGGDGLGITVFPMDWTVKALLRPRSRPVVK